MKLISVMVSVVLSVLVISPVFSQAICVKGSLVNVRSGPGKEYKTVWQVFRHMPLKKVGVSLSGDWYAVRDMDGDVSWIHKSLVTSSYRCAIVKSDIANVRIGPGTRYHKKYSEPMTRYDSFKVLKTKGGWVKVADDINRSGWIHKKYLWMN